MAFAFEELKVYQKALDFAVNVIKAIDEIDAPRKHFRLFEQIESVVNNELYAMSYEL